MIVQQSLANLVSQFELHYEYDLTLAPSFNLITTQNTRHCFFVDKLDETHILECVAKAKLNEMASTDMFRIDCIGSRAATDAFETLTSPLLMIWLYGVIQSHLDHNSHINELNRLLKNYTHYSHEAYSEQMRSFLLEAYGVLRHQGILCPETLMHSSLIHATPIIEAVLRYANQAASLENVCAYFNEYALPIKATILEKDTVLVG
jgi:hypothetical protein